MRQGPCPQNAAATPWRATEAGGGWRHEALSQMAGPLSHALRNRLGTISLHLGIIEEELQPLNDEARGQAGRSLAIVNEHVARLHDLMQQYLLIGRSWHESRQAVDAADYLKLFCAEMGPALAADAIALQLEAALPIGAIAIYERGFRQALQHLLRHVGMSMAGGATLHVRCYRQGNRAAIDVCASGRETPPVPLDNAFDPFHDPALAANGLGLFLVREIVHAHQGDMAMASEADASATLRITLPLLPPLHDSCERQPED